MAQRRPRAPALRLVVASRDVAHLEGEGLDRTQHQLCLRARLHLAPLVSQKHATFGAPALICHDQHLVSKSSINQDGEDVLLLGVEQSYLMQAYGTL